MDFEELRRRETTLIREEREKAGGVTSFWYLSYASEEGFRGGVIVRAFGFIHACHRARDLQINPGGQIRGFPVPAPAVPPAKYLDKCLTKAELEECWGEMKPLEEEQ